MQHQGLTEEDAKNRIRDEIIQREKQYYEAKRDYMAVSPPCARKSMYFGLLELSIAGTALWNIYCPRYNLSEPRPKREDTDGDGGAAAVGVSDEPITMIGIEEGHPIPTTEGAVAESCISMSVGCTSLGNEVCISSSNPGSHNNIQPRSL